MNLRAFGVAKHLLTNRIGLADHEVRHAARHTRSDEDIHHFHRGERRVLRRTDDDAAAGRKGSGRRSGDVVGWKIPRGNDADDADRLLEDGESSGADPRRNDPSVRPFALFGKPFEQVGGHQPFAAGLPERLAALEHGRPRDAVGLRANEIGRSLQDRAAIVRRPAGPARQGPLGRVNRRAGI